MLLITFLTRFLMKFFCMGLFKIEGPNNLEDLR
jgi:hypothetical protein